MKDLSVNRGNVWVGPRDIFIVSGTLERICAWKGTYGQGHERLPQILPSPFSMNFIFLCFGDLGTQESKRYSSSLLIFLKSPHDHQPQHISRQAFPGSLVYVSGVFYIDCTFQISWYKGSKCAT